MAQADDDRRALLMAYDATRMLLRARNADVAQEILLSLCRDLGGQVVSADSDDPTALPINLALLDTEPVLPASADRDVVENLRRYLVPATLDARLSVEGQSGRDRLVERATRDPLTRLWNRGSLQTAINATQPGDVIGLIDLDHFKRINDTLGHEMGDSVLTAFASHLLTSLREADVVGRLGGEEFVVVFHATLLSAVQASLERVAAAWPEVAPVPVTFSAGLAVVKLDAGSEDVPGRDALRRADALMYKAKSAGRDTVAVESG